MEEKKFKPGPTLLKQMDKIDEEMEQKKTSEVNVDISLPEKLKMAKKIATNLYRFKHILTVVTDDGNINVHENDMAVALPYIEKAKENYLIQYYLRTNRIKKPQRNDKCPKCLKKNKYCCCHVE